MTHDFKLFPELTNNQMQFYYFDSPHKQITEDFFAKVVKVTDGDTIRVEWLERDFDFPIRLARIQAAEIDTIDGRRSQKFLEKELLGEEVLVQINPRNRTGKWGRIIGDIIHAGSNVNDMSMDFRYAERF